MLLHFSWVTNTFIAKVFPSLLLLGSTLRKKKCVCVLDSGVQPAIPWEEFFLSRIVCENLIIVAGLQGG